MDGMVAANVSSLQFEMSRLTLVATMKRSSENSGHGGQAPAPKTLV